MCPPADTAGIFAQLDCLQVLRDKTPYVQASSGVNFGGPMPFIPDEQEKTVKIPIQVHGGRIQFYFDGPLPLLEEGVIGDLVVPALAVLDPQARKLFSEERKIPLFKKGTLLYVQLRPKTPDDAKPFAAHLLRPFLKGIQSFVELRQGLPENAKPVVAQLLDHSFDMFSRLCDNRTPGYLVSVVAGHQSPYPQ